MAIDFNDNLQIRAPKSIDDRYGPWETIEEGLINVPRPYRHDKLTLNINGVEYWFRNGLEDVDLIVKEYGSGGDTSKWEQSTMLVQDVKYGRLYNWYIVIDSRSIAPSGWHIPTLSDFQTLSNFLGGDDVSGGKLKETGNTYWESPNVDASNSVNFNARGSGVRDTDGSFYLINRHLGFWAYDEYSNSEGKLIDISNDNAYVLLSVPSIKETGRSIRLIKDNSINEGSIVIDGITYHSVTIGNQVWLQQNLATTHYQNGDLIGSDFSGTEGAVAAYNNDENTVYNLINGEDPIHIKPKDNKRINADIIDGLPIKNPVIINFTEAGVFDVLNTYDIIITNGTNINLWLPVINDVVDGKQLIFKNENSTNVSNILVLDLDAQIENLGHGVPYQIPPNSSITLITNRISNKWDIISEYIPPKNIIQETPTGATDSVNTEFVLSKEPKDIFNLQVYEDSGVSYVVSYFDANTIYLIDTPGSHITCRYIPK